MLAIKIEIILLPSWPDIATAALTKTIEHDIQGDFKVEGHTIVISLFSYDGVGLDATFYVGTGTSTGCPSGQGTRLGDQLLKEHAKQRVELDLPANIKAAEVIWSGGT